MWSSRRRHTRCALVTGVQTCALPIFYISEIFPTPVRARGRTLCASTHWLMNALIAGIFPVLVAWSPGAPFAIFAAAMVLQFVVVAAVFPETKGVALDDMAQRIE